MKKVTVLITILLIISLCKIVFAYLENDFIDNENETITDNTTGLTWQKCSAGQSGNSCSGSAETITWKYALTYCEDLDFASFQDWRLPDAKELATITDESKINPAINTDYFPNTIAGFYWTSTTYAGSTSYAWGVHFYHGYLSYYYKASYYYVRCMRG